MAISSSTADNYNREINRINKIFSSEINMDGTVDTMTCKVVNGELKDICNDVNLNVILRHYKVMGIEIR